MEKFIDKNLMKINKEIDKLEERYDKQILETEKNKLYIQLTRLEGKFEAYMEMLSELKQCKL